MEKLINYKKYYLLEDYLFREISLSFKNKNYLTEEEFFAIIIWKSNRSKTKVLNGIKKNGKTIKEITESLSKETDIKNKVKILTNIKGIGIPIASAILSVCYPNDFTIADYRVAETLAVITNKIIKNPSLSIDNFIEYINLCQTIKTKEGISSLRETDQSLWGYDFFEGKNGLKELIRNI